ncbi:MAG TPA: carotenoid 1,2-hydratase [Armatimonadetes bacterium]|nr:carotenoid 1,2-hydratase [Armatimonadota bacterium]
MDLAGVLLGLCWLLGASSPAAGEFAPALEPREWNFPGDHAAHPSYRLEWWYYTGHLETPAGQTFGYQLTFFRVGLRPGPVQRTSRWAFHTVYFAHLALTDERRRQFRYAERAERGALGLAGAKEERYRVWIGDWWVELRGQTHHLHAATPKWGLDLRLTPLKPPVLHGTQGLSQKGEGMGQATYYYSLTRLRTAGHLTVDGQKWPVKGLSWMDHEFGSGQLAPEQVGWDWFSLQLNDGTEVMLYLMRRKDGTVDPYSHGTFVFPDGTTRPLPWGDYRVERLATWRSARSGATYPARWRLRVPSVGLEVTVIPTVAAQELITTRSTGVTYWEGSVRVQGTRQGRRVQGVGYVELTGYAEPLTTP